MTINRPCADAFFKIFGMEAIANERCAIFDPNGRVVDSTDCKQSASGVVAVCGCSSDAGSTPAASTNGGAGDR